MATTIKNSEILRLARKRIESGRNVQVYYAIEDGTVEAGYLHLHAIPMMKWVAELLDPYMTLPHWLRRNRHITEAEFFKTLTKDTAEFRKLRETNLAWLDWMIAEQERLES